MRLHISIEKIHLEVELSDTPNVKAILEKLPFESKAQVWGEEVYFSTPVSAKLEPGAKQVVDPGTVCFWTEGDSIALPFGRTPISTDHRPKLANPCNILGKIEDFALLKKVRPGDKITVSQT
jgi:hypothetical protein